MYNVSETTTNIDAWRQKRMLNVQGSIGGWNAWNEGLKERILSDGVWKRVSHLIMQELHIKETRYF